MWFNKNIIFVMLVGCAVNIDAAWNNIPRLMPLTAAVQRTVSTVKKVETVGDFLKQHDEQLNRFETIKKIIYTSYMVGSGTGFLSWAGIVIDSVAGAPEASPAFVMGMGCSMVVTSVSAMVDCIITKRSRALWIKRTQLQRSADEYATALVQNNQKKIRNYSVPLRSVSGPYAFTMAELEGYARIKDKK